MKGKTRLLIILAAVVLLAILTLACQDGALGADHDYYTTTPAPEILPTPWILWHAPGSAR